MSLGVGFDCHHPNDVDMMRRGGNEQNHDQHDGGEGQRERDELPPPNTATPFACRRHRRPSHKLGREATQTHYHGK